MGNILCVQNNTTQEIQELNFLDKFHRGDFELLHFLRKRQNIASDCSYITQTQPTVTKQHH